MRMRMLWARTVAVVLICLLGAALAGCGPGLSDWGYDLPNGYAIWRCNSETIVLGKKTSDYSMENRVGSYISAFCHDDRYVCVKQIGNKEDLNATNGETTSFYVIDTLEDIVFGPYGGDELDGKLKELNVALPGAWIKTVPRPRGAAG